MCVCVCVCIKYKVLCVYMCVRWHAHVCEEIIWKYDISYFMYIHRYSNKL